jgi:hypothetical protein
VRIRAERGRLFLLPSGVAFCVGAEIVAAAWLAAPQPAYYLIRPVVVVAVLAVVVGMAASVFGRSSGPVALFAMFWLLIPGSGLAIATAVLLAGLVVWRLWHHRPLDVQAPVAVAAAVFLVAGLLPVIPLLSWSSSARAESEDALPQFLILVDGYPRADSLAELGVDVGGFVDALEARGFDHYPEATSKHDTTWQTLTLMFAGVDAPDRTPTVSEKRNARMSWRLPDGFAVIAPPQGSVTLPHLTPLNPGGLTILDAALLQDSAAASLVGGYIMDGLRARLNDSLDLLTTTDKRRVFAHLLAPHIPFLYDGDKSLDVVDCWPSCNPLNMSVDSAGVGGYLEWLNPRLIKAIDAILTNHPDAEIVIFSDHGGRFDPANSDEWHRVFLASRTPSRPQLFAKNPHPRAIIPHISSVGNPLPPAETFRPPIEKPSERWPLSERGLSFLLQPFCYQTPEKSFGTA